MRKLWIWGALALSLTVAEGALAQPKAAVGKISFVTGTVFRSTTEDGPFKRVMEEHDVFEGDVLKTEPESRVEAKLEDKSVLRLGPDSRLRIETAKFQKKAETKQVSVKLIVGRAWASVSKLFGSSSFDVHTSNAVAGVRGTAFGVDSGKDKSTTVRVFSGKVLISNKPVYMTEEPKKPKGDVPFDKRERKEVKGPQEISKKQWEETVAGALQQVRVAANGDLGNAESFAAADAEKDEWIAWNRQRDKASGHDE